MATAAAKDPIFLNPAPDTTQTQPLGGQDVDRTPQSSCRYLRQPLATSWSPQGPDTATTATPTIVTITANRDDEDSSSINRVRIDG